MKIIHFLREECKIKGGGEKIKGVGFKKGGGLSKKGGNLPPFPPLVKTLYMYVIYTYRACTHREGRRLGYEATLLLFEHRKWTTVSYIHISTTLAVSN